MGRPFRLYCMRLAERLGYKSLKNLYAELDNNEIMEWAAYDLTNDAKWREDYDKELNSLEAQKEWTPEEEAEKIRAMFMGLGGKK